MAALGNQHRVGLLGLTPQTANVAVCHTVDVDLGVVVDRNYLAQSARIDDLLDLHKVGVEAQNVAHANHNALTMGVLLDGQTLLLGLRDGFFQQNVVARIDRAHRRLEVLILGGADQHRVGLDLSGEEIVE